MRFKHIFLTIVLLAALAIAFLLGRTTAQPDASESEDHAGEAGHAAPAGNRSAVLTLTPEMQQKFGLRLVKVERRTMPRIIQATGSVGANEARMAHIRPPARGRIHEVHVQLGDRVRAGQQLIVFDNADLGDAIGDYLAWKVELQKSASETEVARQALERARKLVELGAIARAELQRREAEFKNALAEDERRKAAAAQVEEKLHRYGLAHADMERLEPGRDYHREASYSVLNAPFSGVVTQLEAVPGEAIDTDDLLITVSDLGIVWVWADLYEKDIRSVNTGQMAEVRVQADAQEVYRGKVTYISDALDSSTRTAKVRVETPNPEGRLKMEMFATVSIPSAETRAALVIPAAALQQIDNAPVAFVRQSSGSFEKRGLRLGGRSGGWVEVTGGLEEGEEVVGEGSFLLKSEAKRGELGHHED